MIPPTIRDSAPADRAAIDVLVADAFGGPLEAALVGRLVEGGYAVVELVADLHGAIVGHVLFSRLQIDGDGAAFPAIALAPLAVATTYRQRGIAAAMIEAGHERLAQAGERLSVVLGEPHYYSRFGYDRGRAIGFDSPYQCEALQALSWGTAPQTGRLVYPAPFAEL